MTTRKSALRAYIASVVLLLLAAIAPEKAEAISYFTKLNKCFQDTEKRLCFDSFTRVDSVVESFVMTAVAVNFDAINGPGYGITDFGYDAHHVRGAFPRRAYLVGWTTFCATGGTHRLHTRHMWTNFAFGNHIFFQLQQRTIFIPGNPCGPIW